MMKRLCRIFALVIVLLPLAPARASAQTISLEYLGMVNTGQTFRGADGATISINGLSGITHVRDDQFLAVMDNSNTVVRMGITFDRNGAMTSAHYTGVIKLSERRDFEGIAVASADDGQVYLSEEDTPAIRRFSLNSGQLIDVLRTPPIFARERRTNFGFESLTIQDGQMWTANEEALRCDGDRSTAKTGTVVRLVHLVLRQKQWTPTQQFVYVTDPIPQAYNDADRSTSRSGVSDLMLLPDGRLAVLERAFALSGPANLLSKFRNRIYLVDFNGATDVSGERFARGLNSQNFTPVKKTLLWSHEANDIGNLEGLGLGPKLGDQRWGVVGIVDNNAKALMPNRVVSFELTIAPPSSGPG